MSKKQQHREGPTMPTAPVSPGVPASTATTTPVKEKGGAGLGAFAVALGALGIVFALIPGASAFGIFLGVVAVIFGGVVMLRRRRRALPGVIVGGLAVLLGSILLGAYSSGSPSASTASSAASSSASSRAATSRAGIAPAAAAPTQAPSKAPELGGTPAQLQALAAARGYLTSGIGFSQASLTAQLTSSSGNGFALPDAQWAVEHSGADWNDQALRAAKGYLTSGMGFSAASLTSQLTSAAGNQFTPAQAAYAVANAGADWNAEALKAAKGYLASGIGFSRQSLIAQLTSSAGNQFTEAQAEYAADQVGVK